MKRGTLRKKGKSITSILQKECDKLLQQVNQYHHRKCEACGNQNEVGHHWIEKSRSNYLRYVLENIVPLCNSCHSKIHNVFGNNIIGSLNVAEVIIQKRGKEWKERLDKMQKQYIKTDKSHYTSVQEFLLGELDLDP